MEGGLGWVVGMSFEPDVGVRCEGSMLEDLQGGCVLNVFLAVVAASVSLCGIIAWACSGRIRLELGSVFWFDFCC